jgi:hypothetical protein
MGDPACWMARTCLVCGAFAEEGLDACPRCGEPLADGPPAAPPAGPRPPGRSSSPEDIAPPP